MKRLILSLALLCAASLSICLCPFSLMPLMAQTDRGFVHPGGLHTQADFDRVKAQIAAGNATVKAAYQKLTSAAYAQSSVQTYPVETIVRGGGNGENYINACRGATMAYQNALRWKIGGTKANADAAVRILMAWANTTKAIGGDSNYALAAGLYGYQFAQAAELMRDYEGWSREDFTAFQRWMLNVWYPSSIGFLRGRNGTWENSGKWWQAPGHYWSNWGLCNALCVSMIGILCDDVFIYNQGMSYFKYDQCGTFTEVRSDVPIKNDGLTEFLGNLVVTTYGSDLETGAYGLLGQMNESGRDTGHSAMALGLAVDLAKVGWNQGDDLFAYMSHRLAAGIEYVAAQTQSVAGLPWVNYQYGQSGYYYTDSRAYVMTEPALGAQMRPYWGTVIGIYEGVKGVRMPFSEVSYKNMGIDEGGQGSTSGGYDHLGYSVLMNTRDEQLCPEEKVPTELTPKMEYSGTLSTNLIPSLTQERSRGLVSGKVISHNELGGLVNTFTANNNTTVPTGQTLTLMPQLPDGEEDTGLWQWDTGETTRDITIQTDQSHIYRVTYTNARGIESQLSFAIAVKGDCTPDRLVPSVTYNGESVPVVTYSASVPGGPSDGETSPIDILYGKTASLSVTPSAGWGTYKWSTGATTQTITTPAIKKDQDISVTFTNQGGATTTMVFHLHVLTAIPYVTIGETTTETDEVVVEEGGSVTLGLTTPTTVAASKVTWSDGTTGSKTLTLEDLHTSGDYTATFPLSGEDQTFTFHVFVKATETATVEPGDYLIQHVGSGRLLTAHGKNQLVTFDEGDTAEPGEGQTWYITTNGTRYALISLPDSLSLSTTVKTITTQSNLFFFDRPIGADRYALHTGSTTSTTRYWAVDADGTVLTTDKTLTAYPYRLIPVKPVGIGRVASDLPSPTHYYTLDGLRHDRPRRGVNIIQQTREDGTQHSRKIILH
ncbi:MAG: alginate lyase family protein [Bacteroidaceae bacterium]|nr:alginate lyase family protein [Bacteroidaceae bacterium]